MGNNKHQIDLHGFHPYDADLKPTIDAAIRKAWEAGAEKLLIIHGHGMYRLSSSPQFANTNTGFLGLTVRGYLRNTPHLREWMFAKIIVSDPGTTTVRLRPQRKSI